MYLAAHGGFAGKAVPLGGGAAIANQLEEEWARTKPFEMRVVGPGVLGAGAPSAEDLVRFNEREYAAFCDRFRERCTELALECDPCETAVLANDISEGPDFERLASAGFRIFTIWHVDVVAYIADIYLRGMVKPERLASWWEGLRAAGIARVFPRILQLIFAQQRACVAHSRAVIVPSAGMKEIVGRAYPWAPEDRVQVMPWGARGDGFAKEEVEAAARGLREEFGVKGDERVLLCLSRISPEKGQDALLEALRAWKGPPVTLFLCGAPAFMQGERFYEKLRRLAGRLRGVRTIFPGYVSGLRKSAFFRLADLYVFPSRHESYGLTLMEALSAGLPAVCLNHQGARETMREEFGAIVENAEELPGAIARLLEEGPELRRRGEAARRYAQENSFSRCAERLARLIQEA